MLVMMLLLPLVLLLLVMILMVLLLPTFFSASAADRVTEMPPYSPIGIFFPSPFVFSPRFPFQSQAVSKGCRVLDSFPVRDIQGGGGQTEVAVTVSGPRGSVRASGGAVVCAGPWTGRIMEKTG